MRSELNMHQVLYRNVYTNGGNQAVMIKSNGGSGSVKNVLFQNFISRGVAYGLDIDQYWSSQTTAAGSGVALSNIEFQNWDGYVVDGSRRAPVQIICADGAPCANITLSSVNMWASNSVASAKCRSAYGSGIGCLKANSGQHTSYAAATSSYGKPGARVSPFWRLRFADRSS
jgi:rhamnogalacturonan hydrolase